MNLMHVAYPITSAHESLQTRSRSQKPIITLKEIRRRWSNRNRRGGSFLLWELFLVPLHVNWRLLQITSRGNAVFLSKRRHSLVITLTVNTEFFIRIETCSTGITFVFHNYNGPFRHFCNFISALEGSCFLSPLLFILASQLTETLLLPEAKAFVQPALSSQSWRCQGQSLRMHPATADRIFNTVSSGHKCFSPEACKICSPHAESATDSLIDLGLIVDIAGVDKQFAGT